MKILYASRSISIDEVRSIVNNPQHSMSYDISRELPYTDYLCEKLANYSLSPNRFEVITSQNDHLWSVLESVSYKELTRDVLKDALLHGFSGESWFINEIGEIKVKRINPLSLIVIKETEYDEPHTVVYYETLPTSEVREKEELTFFNDKRVWIDNGNSLYIFEKGKLIKEIHHNLKIPSINVFSPFKGFPFFEKQKILIKQYEEAFKFLAHEAKSTVNILVMPSSAKDIKEFGDLRVLEGVNFEDGKPELLVKSPEYLAMFKFKDELEKRIAKETGIVDFSSQENASQDALGEALKIRLTTLEDKCQVIFTKMMRFLKNRHKIISKLGNFSLDESNVSIKLSTNIPESLLPKIQAYGQMLNLGIISLESTQEHLGIDPEVERERIQAQEEMSNIEISEAHESI